MLRSFPGNACVFENDGTVFVQDNDSITKYDGKLNRKWVTPVTSPHHTFHRSQFGDELLLLQSEFTFEKSKTIRSDILTVIDSSGKIIKTAKFDTLLAQMKKSNFDIRSTKPATWLDALTPGKNPKFERSHVNSFFEYYEEKDGNRIHAGYVISCNLQKIIVIVSKDLKKVLKFINIDKRYVHSVQQVNSQQLMFYQNQNAPLNGWNSSLIGGFDLAKEEFFEIYRPDPKMRSLLCSFVQMLPDGKLFITHSNCEPGKKDFNIAAVFEIYDPVKKVSAYQSLGGSRTFAEGKLLNLTEYFRNSQGM